MFLLLQLSFKNKLQIVINASDQKESFQLLLKPTKILMSRSFVEHNFRTKYTCSRVSSAASHMECGSD